MLTGQGQLFGLNFSTANEVGLVSPDITFGGGVAPSSLIAVGAPTTSTTVGTALPAAKYPRVRALDAHQQPIAGANIDFYQVGGACSPHGGTLVTDANGEVALTAATLIVPVNVAGSCIVQAVATDADINGVDFGIVVAPVGMVTWLGANSGEWTLAANWTPRVPLATDNVYIPENVLNIATLSGPVTIAVLLEEAVDNNAQLNVNVSQLTVTGDVNVSIDGGIFGTGGFS